MEEKSYKEQLSITLDSLLIEVVKDTAGSERRSVSNMIEVLLEEALKQRAAGAC
jgi:hypothetical protein